MSALRDQLDTFWNRALAGWTQVGGHIVDRAADGSECRWARILVFEPPSRVVFSWDIGPTRQLEPNPDNASADGWPMYLERYAELLSRRGHHLIASRRGSRTCGWRR